MMRNPEAEITLYRGNVQISNSTLVELIPRIIKYLEPIHKAQLLGIKRYQQDNAFLTKTHFTTLRGIYKRYAEKLMKALNTSNEDDKLLLANLVTASFEAESFEKQITKILSSLSAKEGNFEIRKRPA